MDKMASLKVVFTHLSKGQLSKDHLDISPRRLLSKETLVQGDYCPRWKFETLRAVHIIFLSFYNQSISLHPIENKENNLSKLITSKSFLGQKSPRTKISLENCPSDICPLDHGNCPLDKCGNTNKSGSHICCKAFNSFS